MTADREILRVVYDRTAVGVVIVTDRSPRKIIGQFEPGPDFHACEAAFAEASRWARRFDESHGEKCLDYPAFNNYLAAIGRITKRIELPELNESVEEFAVDHLSRVEITLTGVVV